MWQSIKKHREWLLILAVIIVVAVIPRLSHIPTPIPFPKQYPLKKAGTFDEGSKAYKEGNFGLALANFISSASHHTDVKSMSMASLMYVKGQGVQRDICQGIYWADMAARNGVYFDQELLSRAYFQSYGIDSDYEKAYLWAKAAVENRNIDTTNKWYKELTGETFDPKSWMNSIQDFYSKEQIKNYRAKYAKWDYKKAGPVKIVRTRHIPFIGMSTVVPCSKNILQ